MWLETCHAHLIIGSILNQSSEKVLGKGAALWICPHSAKQAWLLPSLIKAPKSISSYLFGQSFAQLSLPSAKAAPKPLSVEISPCAYLIESSTWQPFLSRFLSFLFLEKAGGWLPSLGRTRYRSGHDGFFSSFLIAALALPDAFRWRNTTLLSTTQAPCLPP